MIETPIYKALREFDSSDKYFYQKEIINMKKYYDCYSYNLMKFLLANGIVPVKISKHYKTQRTYWVFEKDNALDDMLYVWSEGKK